MEGQTVRTSYAIAEQSEEREDNLLSVGIETNTCFLPESTCTALVDARYGHYDKFMRYP